MDYGTSSRVWQPALVIRRILPRIASNLGVAMCHLVRDGLTTVEDGRRGKGR